MREHELVRPALALQTIPQPASYMRMPSPQASLFPGASVCAQCAAGWYSNVSGAYLSDG
jgi:hypothetical protein